MTATHTGEPWLADPIAAALFQLVLDDPGNDDHRLMLAERLEELGLEGWPDYSERAALIRVQCDSAACGCNRMNLGGGCSECHPLLRHEWKLLCGDDGRQMNWVTWIGSSFPGFFCENLHQHGPCPTPWLRFRRGFVSHIRVTMAAFAGEPCRKCAEHGSYTIYRGPGATNLCWIDCTACDGTGTIAGLAGPLFAAAPIEAVEFSDREPVLGATWHWWTRSMHSVGPSHLVLSDVFNMLTGFINHNETARGYRTAALANAALCAAAVAFGRATRAAPANANASPTVAAGESKNAM